MLGECIGRLTAIGISYHDASALRRISMTLHRWHELECGDSNEHASWCITRGKRQIKIGGKFGDFEHDDNGDAYLERHSHSENAARYSRIPDREKGALKRLAAIVARYPGLLSYVQGDPRGASLYILRASDVPAGANIDSCYNRGVAVYK